MLKSFLLAIFLLTAQVDRVETLDRQIEVLEELKEKYESDVQRKVNNAMRWQFQRENYLDARRTWDEVAVDKQKIQEIQDQIDDLKKQRAELVGKEKATAS